MIGTTYKTRQKANNTIDAVCESFFSHLVVTWPPVMPHVGNMYMLQPFMIPHVRHAHLGLVIAVSLKGRTTCIWSFGCGFACATTMGCAGFKLKFGMITVL